MDNEPSIKLTLREMNLLRRLAGDDGWHNDLQFSRRSDREFDIILEGSNRIGLFSAWLVLAAINHFTDWTTPPVANMTDYPEMARSGDWSGVRDSKEDRIWEIFEKFVAPHVPQ